MADPIDVFFSYAPSDEGFRIELEAHLALLRKSGVIRALSWMQLDAGAPVRETMDAAFDAAQVILLLVSADFLESDGCDAEVGRALARQRAGEACVIPIILRDCD